MVNSMPVQSCAGAMYMQSMISVIDWGKWFLSFDIACDGYRSCNGVIYILVPLEPVTPLSRDAGNPGSNPGRGTK